MGGMGGMNPFGGMGFPGQQSESTRQAPSTKDLAAAGRRRKSSKEG